MILLFGGTTEGRKAAKELEEAGKSYFYSTKSGEQDIVLHYGTCISGAMDKIAMTDFCTNNSIRLIVDAAHPFAQNLHQTVANVAAKLSVPAIRFERIFPKRASDITWIDDYCDIPDNVGTMLATTGVQTIAKLLPLQRKGVKIYYRILRRKSSIILAHKQGATDNQLCFYDSEYDELEVMKSLGIDTLLLKESGLTGGFLKKTNAARQLGINIIALKKPATPGIFHCVNGEHGMRRMVEKLLPDFYPLRSGLTTGTYSTAAAVADATRKLLGRCPEKVPVVLPNGETIEVEVYYSDDYAYVIKESGDDPDVTNGIEIRAEVQPADNFSIVGGKGVGTVTLPGFDVSVGEAAINKVPRQMIYDNIQLLLNGTQDYSGQLSITISVPDGEEIAKRTFNPRLGITGGISIVGVSGIIKPFSEDAFVDSIRRCMMVAKAGSPQHVVINSGAKSERYLKNWFAKLPQQAFVEYGNFIGKTLEIAEELKFERITLGVMLGKAVKLAAGNLDTHSKKVVMDKDFVFSMLREAGCNDATIARTEDITLARELWERVPEHLLQAFANTVIRHCLDTCLPAVPSCRLDIMLIDDNGNIWQQKVGGE